MNTDLENKINAVLVNKVNPDTGKYPAEEDYSLVKLTSTATLFIILRREYCTNELFNAIHEEFENRDE